MSILEAIRYIMENGTELDMEKMQSHILYSRNIREDIEELAQEIMFKKIRKGDVE